ncbi:MAG: 2-amino-4-hydroxy-6-hydroxymethyldihydropteridine diphosphokinase [Clostridiales bacterium]|nr:2-amino-4-hydroxy-6-hydroxymethyldihydropteridine diphosphokinase [Clostridiales bacterium]
MQKKVVYLSLGSNIGNRFVYIDDAIEAISKISKIKISKQSSYYETAPVGYENQNNFINVCVEVETSFTPMELLGETQKIENSLGRTREIHWGPRTIDIDILLYDDLKIKNGILTIPHERMTLREFVLVPLKEINKNIVINGKEIDEYLDRIEGQGVKKIENE